MGCSVCVGDLFDLLKLEKERARPTIGTDRNPQDDRLGVQQNAAGSFIARGQGTIPADAYLAVCANGRPRKDVCMGAVRGTLARKGTKWEWEWPSRCDRG